MSRGCPEDVPWMSIGCIIMRMYNNAYISMSRNHNDSDLVQIDDTRKPGTFTQWNCDCGKTRKTSAWLFLMKKFKGCLEDVWMMSSLNEKSERISKDVQRMSRECPEIFQRMSRECPEDVQRASRGHPELYTSV